MLTPFDVAALDAMVFSPSGYTSAAPRESAEAEAKADHRYDGSACGMGAQIGGAGGEIKP
jgi:hypothetical protein